MRRIAVLTILAASSLAALVGCSGGQTPATGSPSSLSATPASLNDTLLLTTNRDRLAICVEAVDQAKSVASEAKSRIETALQTLALLPSWQNGGLAAAAPVVDVGCPSPPAAFRTDVRIGWSGAGQPALSPSEALAIDRPSKYLVFAFVYPDSEITKRSPQVDITIVAQEYLRTGSDKFVQVTTGLYLTPGYLQSPYSPYLKHLLAQAIAVEPRGSDTVLLPGAAVRVWVYGDSKINPQTCMDLLPDMIPEYALLDAPGKAASCRWPDGTTRVDFLYDKSGVLFLNNVGVLLLAHSRPSYGDGRPCSDLAQFLIPASVDPANVGNDFVLCYIEPPLKGHEPANPIRVWAGFDIRAPAVAPDAPCWEFTRYLGPGREAPIPIPFHAPCILN